jgi:hypothetical protein
MQPPHQLVPVHLAEDAERPEEENDDEDGAKRHLA